MLRIRNVLNLNVFFYTTNSDTPFNSMLCFQSLIILQNEIDYYYDQSYQHECNFALSNEKFCENKIDLNIKHAFNRKLFIIYMY